MIRPTLVLIAFSIALAGCATASVDLTEPRRVLGRSGDVRLDGQIFNERLQPGASVRMVWDVTNERPESIAIADLDPIVVVTPDSPVMTVQYGSEVPGNELLPRLIEIAPGEKRSFSMAARLPSGTELGGGVARAFPREIRLQLVYLTDVEPFRELVGIPERAIQDADRADELFDEWVAATRTVNTNTLPIDWTAGAWDPVNASSRRPGR